MTISRKLVLGYLAFAIPTLVLLILFDAGFARTSRQAFREERGIAYAERVYAVQQALSAYQLQYMAGEMTTDTARDESADDTMDARAAATEAAFSELRRYHDETGDQLDLTRASLRTRGLAEVAPDALHEIWIGYRETESAAEYVRLLDGLLRLGAVTLDLSGATQDPSLNTNSMIRAVMVYLPEYSRILSEVIAFPAASAGLGAYETLLDNLARIRVIALIDFAMAGGSADAPVARTARHLVRDELAQFQARHAVLAGMLESSATAGDHARMLTAARDVFDAAQVLYEAGREAIRTAIESRRARLIVWRVTAIALTSLVFVMVASLLAWIRRSIAHSVDGIIDYTSRVARGDYAAHLRVGLSEDLAQLYDHTRSMVSEIVQLAEFPRQNPNGVLAAERSGEVIYRNPTAQRYLDEHAIEIDDLLPATHSEIISRLARDTADRQTAESRLNGRHLEWNYHPVRGSELVHIYFSDVTDRKRAEAQLRHDAFHDSLTGLPNRALLLDRIDQTLSLARRDADAAYGLLLLDVDRFKLVNESLGHSAGDELIRRIATRLAGLVGERGTVARLGGDEFGVLIAPLSDSRQALALAREVHEILAEPIDLGTTRLSVTVSIGIVLPAADREDAESVLRDADSAMYRAKGAGRARSEVFNASMYQDALSALTMETELAAAIADGAIVPWFQPIVSLGTGGIAGFEALARWNHPEHGVVSPGRFIPLAEETGLIVPLGQAILDQAITKACEWRHSGHARGEFIISINLSVKQFTEPRVIDQIAATIGRHDVEPHCVKLEITESGLMQDVEASMELLSRLKSLDVQLGIDDFGTGYSSLSYLHRFPFDVLKVDQSFVGRMEAERESREIVTNIISLAHGLGKVVISEGIETDGQLSSLRSLGSEFGQGFLFSRPLPATEAGEMLRADPRW